MLEDCQKRESTHSLFLYPPPPPFFFPSVTPRQLSAHLQSWHLSHPTLIISALTQTLLQTFSGRGRHGARGRGSPDGGHLAPRTSSQCGTEILLLLLVFQGEKLCGTGDQGEGRERKTEDQRGAGKGCVLLESDSKI